MADYYYKDTFKVCNEFPLKENPFHSKSIWYITVKCPDEKFGTSSIMSLVIDDSNSEILEFCDFSGINLSGLKIDKDEEGKYFIVELMPYAVKQQISKYF